MISAEAGAPFEATYDSGTTGLVGTLEVAILDNDGATVFGPSAASIIELSVGGQPTAVYRAELTAPGSVGQYSIAWSDDGTFDPATGAVEPLLVVAAGATGTLPPLTPIETDEFAPGPCQAWTDGDLIAECCSSFTGGTLTDELEDWARFATEILFAVSGGIYSGACGPITVRPCADGCGCWSIVAQRVGWSWDAAAGYWGCGGRSCGCAPLSEVWLAGYPREVTEVKIDGAVLDPSEYRLDPGGRLLRMRDPADPDVRLLWPSCQIIDLDDTEEGTFSVAYTYGLDPPQSARDAAAALACQLWAACNNSGRCKLPANTKQVARGGITIEIGALIAESLKAGATGILAIDSFVAAFGGSSPALSVWSPDLPPYPRRVGPGAT